jgi:tetratricopeptide (TPR) repeat protein
MDSYFRFGLAHKKIECLDEAISYFNKALAISKEIGDKEASRQIKYEISQLS